jgi:hypothetical protein
MRFDAATFEKREDECDSTTAQPRRRSKEHGYARTTRFQNRRGKGNHVGIHRRQMNKSLSTTSPA